MDSKAIENAQRVAARVTAEADGDAWKEHQWAVARFLSGSRTAVEEERWRKRLGEWRERIVTSLAVDAYAEVAESQDLLLSWLLTELRRGDDALGSLLALYPLPRPEPEPISASGTPTPETKGELAEFYFADVFIFVTDYLAAMIRRPLDGTSATWCPSWWEHPEAGARLSALWLAWEHLRHDAALGMTTWWIQHADPHLKVLMDPRQGPFAACSPEGHAREPLGPLPVEPYEPT
ncbi:DUF4913 domain-containing protein [Streptomyces sp. NPDC089795]|uniref:DUF4913 domain-containing protein n=1 Tax=Streptomyces sp. NPDC089795 TaxID=3155297 RepID=UPI00344810B8